MRWSLEFRLWGSSICEGEGKWQDWAGAPADQAASLTMSLSAWGAPEQHCGLGGNLCLEQHTSTSATEVF